MNKTGFIDWKHPVGAGWFQLTGSIDSVTAGQFTSAVLNWLDKKPEASAPFVLYLNSIGGNVHDAIAIREMINLMRRQSHKVFIVILRAASCANIVATAGDEVYMGQNSWWMIHAVKSAADGEQRDLECEANIVKLLNEQTMTLIASPQLSAEQLKQMVQTQSTLWLSAEQCLQNGLINGILAEPPIAVRKQ
jgi:ATP-dependent protease ClpP protease subunit